jgi:hypothetical protein
MLKLISVKSLLDWVALEILAGQGDGIEYGSASLIIQWLPNAVVNGMGAGSVDL